MVGSLPVDQIAGLFRRNVGSFRLATVHDGMLDTAFDHVLGVEPAAAEAAHRAARRSLPPQLSCNTFVIDSGRHIALVDAGCGATTRSAGKHLAGLVALGIQPEAVDTLLMTHLHRDHAAGLIDARGQAVFPRAELVVHNSELAFWGDEANMARLSDGQKQDFLIATAVLRTYASRLRPVGAGEVLPGISAVPTPGHTPGHTAWLLASGPDRLLIWGDVVHLPVIQFANPEASVVYDVDSRVAAATRARLLDMVAADGLPVAGVHLDFPCFGAVEARTDGGFSYVPQIWTSTL